MKNSYWSRYTAALCLIAIFLIVSCRGTKDIHTGPIPVRTAKEIIQAIKDHNIEYDWFTAYGKAKFDTDDLDVGTKVYLRMKKDSIIWMTFKKLSITAAQALITPDSFFVIYRLERAYEKGSIDRMKNQYNINMTFGEIQDYFAGNIPIADDTLARVDLIDRFYKMSSRQDSFMIETLVDPYTLEVSKIKASDPNQNEIIASYSKYNEHKEWPMLAYKRNFFINYDKGYGAEISKMTFDFSEITINQPANTPFNIPRHYEDISIP